MLQSRCQRLLPASAFRHSLSPSTGGLGLVLPCNLTRPSASGEHDPNHLERTSGLAASRTVSAGRWDRTERANHIAKNSLGFSILVVPFPAVHSRKVAALSVSDKGVAAAQSERNTVRPSPPNWLPELRARGIAPGS